MQELNLGIQLRICNTPVILKNTEVPYRDFHSLQFFHTVSSLKFFLISELNFPCHINLSTVFFICEFLFFADPFIHSSSSVLSNGCNISFQLLTQKEDKPVGNCNHSYVIKEFTQGEENRTQLLALSRILQC